MSSNCGSSPLAQGTLGSRGRGGNASWLIPARAGNIEGQEYASPFHPAHPRSHGEHREYPPGFFAGFGSSPLARRTHLRMIPNPLHRRLIPARAGNNGRANPSPMPGPAHPRSCGEHAFFATESPAGRGSSPLARGTQAEHCPAQISSPLYSTALIGTEAPTLEGPYRTPYPYPYRRAETYGTARHQ